MTNMSRTGCRPHCFFKKQSLLASCLFMLLCVSPWQKAAVGAEAAGSKLLYKGGGGVDDDRQKKKKARLLGLREKRAQMKAEREKAIELKRQGVDQVSNTEESAAVRSYQLRKKKRKGLLRRKTDLASVLFPGVSPENYNDDELIFMFADLVESKKTQVPFEFHDLPTCKMALKEAETDSNHNNSNNNNKKQHPPKMRKNLGSRLQGGNPQLAPYKLYIKEDMKCKPLCQVKMSSTKVRWMRQLVERQYRIHLSLDSLPVLMRSKEHNYAIRGYPVGFKAADTPNNSDHEEYYLYNHLRFTVTYNENPDEFEGARITGFDVHPVSIDHKIDSGGELKPGSKVLTCDAENEDASTILNNPDTYLPLQVGGDSGILSVLYSYEVKWEKADLPWSDRWDVYLIGAPDDDIHFFAIVNSLMIVIFLTGAVATIMIRTLRKDIATYNEMQTLEDTHEETGWKLLHGDVFRPPRFRMLLSVAVGTGAQIGTAFFCTMLCAMVGLINPMNKGQTLTSVIVLYVLCGSVAGYVSSRLYKYCDAKAWKRNTVATAAAFPGVLVSMFIVLNIFLAFAGAATAVSIWTILALFLLWVCVSTPLVFVGSFFGFRANKIEVPTKTNQIARYIPELSFYAHPPISILLGGTLPFGSVCIEMFFIMSALWLHQIYYVMGFLLAVLLIVAATCAEVSVVMCYLQLCAEDHRWWWKSFFNCASAGLYLFLYSVWFLASKLELVGFLPVMVYLTYMTMISISFSLFCGAVGVVSGFWFTRRIYGAVKVD